MTIQAINRNYPCAISADGRRYTKYPTGNLPYSGYVWNENFNSYSDAAALGAGAVFTDGSRTVASTSIKYGASGASAKMSIRTGDAGGFGAWGGVRALSPTLGLGSEIWIRWREYWPTAFTFSASPHMKLLRLSTEVSGVNDGYLDLYTDFPDGPGGFTYKTIKEGQDIWGYSADTAAIPRDTWITYELYAKFDNVSVNSAGTGRLRFWIDGVNTMDRTDITTLTNATALVKSIYWFTYWNNETPPNNDTYIDDILVSTSANPPIATDAGGRIFIGTG